MPIAERLPEPSNTLGIDGIEFIEYATSQPQAFGAVLQKLGFAAVARHRSRHALPPGVAVPGTPPFRRSMLSPRQRCPASREKAKHRLPPGTVKPKDKTKLRIYSTMRRT